MHSYHTEKYAFHHNGTPEGVLLINEYGDGWTPDTPQFRLQIEEAVLFVGALRLGAATELMRTSETEFRVSGGIVSMTAMSEREPDDSVTYEIPFDDLASFVSGRVEERHLEYFNEDPCGSVSDTLWAVSALMIAVRSHAAGIVALCPPVVKAAVTYECNASGMLRAASGECLRTVVPVDMAICSVAALRLGLLSARPMIMDGCSVALEADVLSFRGDAEAELPSPGLRSFVVGHILPSYLTQLAAGSFSSPAVSDLAVVGAARFAASVTSAPGDGGVPD